MQWLIFAIMGAIFYSAAGLLDKLIMGNYAEDSKAYIVCQVLAQQLFTIPIVLIIGIDFAYPDSLFALIVGALQVLPAIYYMRALQVEEVSKVTALENIYPIFVFIGSVLLLGETLSTKNYVGGLLLLAGSILISYRHNGSASFAALSPAIKPFMLYWIMTAAYLLFMKYLLTSIDEWHLYIWSSLGSLMVAMPLIGIKSTRMHIKDFFAKGNSAFAALICGETLVFLGIISSIFAYSMGSATIVTSVAALQPILTLLLILILGIFVPGLMKKMDENTDRKSVIQKCVCFIIVLVGIYFVC